MNLNTRTANALLVLACGLLASNTASTRLHAQGVIDTVPGWEQSPWVGPVGENGSTTGQSFTVPANAAELESVSLWLRVDGFGPLKYGVYVAAWNGTRLSGALLYQSPMQTLLPPTSPGTATNVTFNTVGTSVVPGAHYIVFLSTSLYHDAVFDQASIGFRDLNVYGGGSAFYQNNGADFASLSTAAWSSSLGASDLAFTARFRVPEPGAGVLLAIGATVLLVWHGNRAAGLSRLPSLSGMRR